MKKKTNISFLIQLKRYKLISLIQTELLKIQFFKDIYDNKFKLNDLLKKTSSLNTQKLEDLASIIKSLKDKSKKELKTFHSNLKSDLSKLPSKTKRKFSNVVHLVKTREPKTFGKKVKPVLKKPNTQRNYSSRTIKPSSQRFKQRGSPSRRGSQKKKSERESEKDRRHRLRNKYQSNLRALAEKDFRDRLSNKTTYAMGSILDDLFKNKFPKVIILNINFNKDLKEQYLPGIQKHNFDIFEREGITSPSLISTTPNPAATKPSLISTTPNPAAAAAVAATKKAAAAAAKKAEAATKKAAAAAPAAAAAAAAPAAAAEKAAREKAAREKAAAEAEKQKAAREKAAVEKAEREAAVAAAAAAAEKQKAEREKISIFKLGVHISKQETNIKQEQINNPITLSNIGALIANPQGKQT